MATTKDREGNRLLGKLALNKWGMFIFRHYQYLASVQLGKEIKFKIKPCPVTECCRLERVHFQAGMITIDEAGELGRLSKSANNNAQRR